MYPSEISLQDPLPKEDVEAVGNVTQWLVLVHSVLVYLTTYNYQPN